MIFTRKAISPVVSTALLLVVAVASVIGFSGWFNEFSDNIIIDIEQDTHSNNKGIKIEGIINNKLYLHSNSKSIIGGFRILNSNKIELCSSKTLKADTRLLMSFDNSTFNTSLVTDLSGYLNNGIPNMIPNISNNCIQGECFSYSKNFYLKIQNDVSLSLTNELTLSAWHYPKSNNIHILSKGSWNSSDSWHNTAYALKGIQQSSNQSSITIGKNYTNKGSLSSKPVLLNSWNFIVATFNNGELKVYINGVLSKNISLNYFKLYNSSNDVLIGALVSGGNYGDLYNGYIDEIAIYSKSISSNQVESLYKIRKAVSYEQLLETGIKKIDLSSCNLEKGIQHIVLVETNKGLIQKSIITR